MKYIIPVMFLLILGYALYKKVRPYDAFVSGAGQAIPFAVKLFPYLAAIFVLTELFEASRRFGRGVEIPRAPPSAFWAFPKNFPSSCSSSPFRATARSPC